MCLFSLLSCICRNTAGRLVSRRSRRNGQKDRGALKAMVDQMALIRRAPGPAYVPR
ncbi:hypothetical protein FBUS_06787 [Fasciolopsis buskii]|uniref:Uncharacterized protein n=1 Tax=Fasciolopsis buskii TaxID=27845 RepID=A0A8E0VJR1_9TREM|nr:hypothetical protein FBUS_06787 [Fasciolopsis buski]